MNDLIVQDTSTAGKLKSFWNRPEGRTGMITIVALGLGAVFLINAMLPTINSFLGGMITMVGQSIVLAGMLGFAAFVIWLVNNRTFQALVKSAFKSSMRAITQVFVEIDPIGIMKNYISTLKGKKRDMDSNITALNGQISVITQKINTNKAGYDNAMKTAAQAQRQNMPMQFSLQARSAGRLQKSNITYQQMLDKMTILYRALKKYQEATAVTIQDLTEEVQVKSDERAAIIAASKAMNGAMSILRGSGPEKELFDQAMEFTVADYGQRLGEIDDFMDTTKSILEGMDLQNGVYDADAMEKLTAWESKADSLMLGGDKRLMLENLHAGNTSGTFGAQPVGLGATVDYAQFFERKA
jgi:hypothetical protein